MKTKSVIRSVTNVRPELPRSDTFRRMEAAAELRRRAVAGDPVARRTIAPVEVTAAHARAETALAANRQARRAPCAA